MTGRAAPRLAWLVWGITVILAVVIPVLVYLNRAVTAVDRGFFTVLVSLAAIVYATVGALIAARARNVIGWSLMVTGLSVVLAAGSEEYVVFGLVTDPGSLPAVPWVGWLILWTAFPAIVPMIVMLLLFPDGRPLTPRWRIVVRVTIALATLGTLGQAVQPTEIGGRFNNFGVRVDNPLGLDVGDPDDLWFLLVALVLLGLFTAAVAAVVSVVIRFRRARGVERSQLKWLAYSATVGMGMFGISILVGTVTQREPFAVLTVAGTSILVLGIPWAVGIAIWRHHLYDVDRVINRTLVYGGVTGLLVGVYLAGVVGLGSLVRSLTGQASNSLVVAASTLAVAGLFRPVLRRVQAFVDGRFYRSRYDAARTLEAFGSRLRDEVDLGALGSELTAVVRATMRPAHASLWLKDAGVTGPVTIPGRSLGTKEGR